MVVAILLTITGCEDKTQGGLWVKADRTPDTCINGWEYFSYYKGKALYINPQGKPERCK